jgi:uncharacterized protein (DUF983 family)
MPSYSSLSSRCPECRHSSIYRRKTKTPELRCKRCGHEWDLPATPNGLCDVCDYPLVVRSARRTPYSRFEQLTYCPSCIERKETTTAQHTALMARTKAKQAAQPRGGHRRCERCGHPRWASTMHLDECQGCGKPFYFETAGETAVGVAKGVGFVVGLLALGQVVATVCIAFVSIYALFMLPVVFFKQLFAPQEVRNYPRPAYRSDDEQREWDEAMEQERQLGESRLRRENAPTYSRSLDSIGLSNRVLNLLNQRPGPVTRVEQVLKMSDRDFLAWTGFGEGLLHELRSRVADSMHCEICGNPRFVESYFPSKDKRPRGQTIAQSEQQFLRCMGNPDCTNVMRI